MKDRGEVRKKKKYKSFKKGGSKRCNPKKPKSI